MTFTDNSTLEWSVGKMSGLVENTKNKINVVMYRFTIATYA